MLTIRRRRHASADLDMTPLMDVVFLLLLFLMLTSSFIDRRAIDLRLPSSSTAAGNANLPLLRVQLLQNGELAIDGEPLTADRLRGQVQRHLAGPAGKDLVLEADLRCSVQQMVTAMDRLKEAGASDVHLVTESLR